MSALNECFARNPSLLDIEFTNAIRMFRRTAHKAVGITSPLERIEVLLRFHRRRKFGRSDGERRR
jgi:hypothetical protein